MKRANNDIFTSIHHNLDPFQFSNGGGRGGPRKKGTVKQNGSTSPSKRKGTKQSIFKNQQTGYVLLTKYSDKYIYEHVPRLKEFNPTGIKSNFGKRLSAINSSCSQEVPYKKIL